MNQRIQLSDHFTTSRILRFAASPIIMMVFTSIYSVVDGFFVSNFAGKQAFAAVNLIMPFLQAFGCIGFMLGTGGSALVAMTLGTGNKKRANELFSMLVCATAVLGVIFTVVALLVLRPAAVLLGATAELLDDCILYGTIITVFQTAFMLQFLFQSFFITAEKPKLGLFFTVAAGLTNMVPVEQMEQLLAQGPFYDLPDRLVDAAYAAANFPLPIVTVDLGTATTFNVVDKDRVFRGGVICPGLSTGLRALGERCAQLPQVHLGSPKKAIGTNTESCMLSGSVLGTAVLIDGMVQRIEEELGSPATLVVTGGLAKYVTPLCRHPLTYDPELLMKGLALLYQLNAPQEHGRSHGGGRHYGQQGRLRAKHPHPNRRTRREPEALVG